MTLNNITSRFLWAVLGVIVFGIFGKAISLELNISPPFPQTPLLVSQNLSQLPSPQIHPLPPFLAQWDETAEDYFDQIQPTPLGYLVWSKSPVKVYLDSPPHLDPSAHSRRIQQWITAVSRAITEWNDVIPLQGVDSQESADIIIKRSRPPLEVTRNPETGEFEFPRARAAQTQYEFYLTEDNPPLLSHRFTIYLSPHQNQEYTLATARHELGHALGIWGHSLDKNDVLYFSQVSHPPKISPRDIATLKKIYQQPTQLGWSLIGEQ